MISQTEQLRKMPEKINFRKNVAPEESGLLMIYNEQANVALERLAQAT